MWFVETGNTPFTQSFFLPVCPYRHKYYDFNRLLVLLLRYSHRSSLPSNSFYGAFHFHSQHFAHFLSFMKQYDAEYWGVGVGKHVWEIGGGAMIWIWNTKRNKLLMCLWPGKMYSTQRKHVGQGIMKAKDSSSAYFPVSSSWVFSPLAPASS